MQTFLPYDNYRKSMESLDATRLGNQVWREGLTLLRGGWKNHPAYKMWKGHEYHLGLYLLEGIEVLQERTQKDYSNIKDKIVIEMNKFENTGKPMWVGNDEFHASHRANLLRKANEALDKSKYAKSEKIKQKYLNIHKWYHDFKWEESPDLPYIWPTNN